SPWATTRQKLTGQPYEAAARGLTTVRHPRRKWIDNFCKLSTQLEVVALTFAKFDTVIADGRWFDGTGGPSAIRNIGIADGRVAAISAAPLDTEGCPNVIDAQGKWVIPGII